MERYPKSDEQSELKKTVNAPEETGSISGVILNGSCLLCDRRVFSESFLLHKSQVELRDRGLHHPAERRKESVRWRQGLAIAVSVPVMTPPRSVITRL